MTSTSIVRDLSLPGDTILINGEWSDAGVGERFDVGDPSTGEVIGQAVAGGGQAAKAAIAAAASAFPQWSATTAYERSDLLYRAHALMIERSESLARLMTLEAGQADPRIKDRGEVRRRLPDLVRRRGQADVRPDHPVGTQPTSGSW